MDDDGKLRQRFKNKRINAAKEGIGCSLTYVQYVGLLREANIVSSDIGNTGYHLARHADSGDYAVGNCSFIWYLDNIRQREESAASRRASIQNLVNANQALAADPVRSEEKRLAAIKGCQPWWKKIRRIARARRRRYEAQAHPSYLGSNNSQYGSFWITNHSQNKKWHVRKGAVPAGYERGRT